jgi:acyl carrier protein
MVDSQKFLEQFKEVLEIENREIGLDDAFREFEEWDSLALLSVIAMIDDEYDVIIKGNQFKELQTLNQVIAYINSQV